VDRFTELQVFVAVAEAEGFAAGARKLGISPPVATRAIADLEARLGIKLLTRTTRYVRATDAGRRYLDDAKRILSNLTEADEAATGINGEPSGHLSITAPMLFGKLFVQPCVLEYLNRYPDTTVGATYLDRIVNLMEEGLDLGIRIGELADSSLRAIRVGSVRRVLCAAPSYIARAGAPQIPGALLQHSIIASVGIGETGISAGGEWHFSGGQHLRLKPRLSVTSNDAALAAAVAGFGITRLLSYQIAQQVADGSLIILLHDYETQPLPIHIVHREGRYASAKIRSFLDLLTMRLRADQALLHNT
jgi:DNA-binding transcriptional LysR family regulator